MGLFFQARQKRRCMFMHGQCRQAIGHHDGQVHATGLGQGVVAQRLRRLIAQASPKVRALQVDVPVRGGAVQQQAVSATFGQLVAEPGVIEGQVHRVPRLGVGKLEVQLGAGGKAGAGAAQGNTRRGQAAQFQPRVVRQFWLHSRLLHPNCAKA
ncbi:hypothetical protein PFLmoz3_01878 [Pseudomonas fluorescens]|uniref:Uncharacterized protein n=1 Tax=Pseudomonas fluorescens TaxID=294 RepID=A0A125QIX2_PSEFL|nr:hypothetical protein PFLmoz3_01878 [Pseudomonas fluorescens]